MLPVALENIILYPRATHLSEAIIIPLGIVIIIVIVVITTTITITITAIIAITEMEMEILSPDWTERR